MNTDKLNRFWLLAVFLIILLIAFTAGILLFWRDKGQELTIISPPQPTFSGQIYISGNIAQPGSFTLKNNDTVQGLIQAAGGTLPDTDTQALQLIVPSSTTMTDSQKIDINQADIWLLQALPGIGEVRAQAIWDYRQTNGHFHNIEELTQVPGISSAIYIKVKDYITTGN